MQAVPFGVGDQIHDCPGGLVLGRADHAGRFVHHKIQLGFEIPEQVPVEFDPPEAIEILGPVPAGFAIHRHPAGQDRGPRGPLAHPGFFSDPVVQFHDASFSARCWIFPGGGRLRGFGV